MRKKELLGLGINTVRYHEFIEELVAVASSKASRYACFANVHMVIEAHSDPSFNQVVNNSGLVAPDGQALCWALTLLYGSKQDRIAGMDVLPDMLQKALELNLSVFFYGGTESTLRLTREFINNKYIGLKLAGAISPPYRLLTPEEESLNIKAINESGADLIFVCLGCPKQEKWMASMVGRIHGLMLGVGGALDVLIGTKKRAPRIMQNFSLEWLYRLAQEPSRLFRRYASTNPIFIYLVCKEMVRTKLFRRVHPQGVEKLDP